MRKIVSRMYRSFSWGNVLFALFWLWVGVGVGMLFIYFYNLAAVEHVLLPLAPLWMSLRESFKAEGITVPPIWLLSDTALGALFVLVVRQSVRESVAVVLVVAAIYFMSYGVMPTNRRDFKVKASYDVSRSAGIAIC